MIYHLSEYLREIGLDYPGQGLLNVTVLTRETAGYLLPAYIYYIHFVSRSCSAFAECRYHLRRVSVRSRAAVKYQYVHSVISKCLPVLISLLTVEILYSFHIFI